MLRRIFAITAFIAVALLTGCASVPRASRDRDAAAKQFEAPPPGKANLYVFRDETFGGNWGATVLLDNRLIGETTHHTFILTQVNPGEHVLVSKAENDANLTFVAEAGKTHFVWQEMKMGMWSARATLHMVDEQRGRVGVQACELVRSP